MKYLLDPYHKIEDQLEQHFYANLYWHIKCVIMFAIHRHIRSQEQILHGRNDEL
jgi:hypothetical protein